MTQFPKVSILIPTYNQIDLLHRAIESSLSQDYPNLEVIVSDDASTISPEPIINSFLSRQGFRYYRHEKNIGRVANYRYLALVLATGEWAVNLDGDDFYTDMSFVSKAIKQLQSIENPIFFQAGQINRYKEYAPIRIPPIDQDLKILSGKKYFQMFYDNYYFSHLSTVYNLALVKKLNFPLYNEDIISSDVSTFLKLSLHGNIILCRDIVGEWTGHEVNCTKTASVISRRDNNNILIKSCFEYALKQNIFSNSVLKNWRRKIKTTLFSEHLLPFLCSKKPFIFFMVSAQIFTLPLSTVLSIKFLNLYFGKIFSCLKSKLKLKSN